MKIRMSSGLIEDLPKQEAQKYLDNGVAELILDKENEHKEWLKANLSDVEHALHKGLSNKTAEYVIKCLKGYRP